LWFLAQRKMNGSRIIVSTVLDQSRS
jgi:hypothetical protein